MKRIMKFAAIAVAGTLVLASCGSAKKAAAAMNPQEEEVNLVFTDAKYQTDSEYFRGNQFGVAQQLSTAKKIAIQNTRQEIAATIQSRLRMLIENYANAMNTASGTAEEGSYQELAQTIVNAELSGIELIGEKAFKQPDGDYRYHVCMQFSKDNLLKAAEEALKNNEQMKLLFDKELFRKQFDSVMNAVEE